MRLIYTYNKFVHSDLAKKEIIKRYYIKSFESARKLNYSIELYTNDSTLEKYVDVCNLSTDDGFLFWDSFKFIPIKKDYSDYIIIDGDVFLTNSIQVDNFVDVGFDTFEYNQWESLYKKDIDKLTELGISEHIPEWSNQRIPIANCGILYFNDKKFQSIYYDRWDKLHRFVYNNQSKFNVSKCTAIAAQYLLTILINYYNKTYKTYSSNVGVPNEYYTHHAGKKKFNREPSIGSTLI